MALLRAVRTDDDNEMLEALAQALVERPRAPLHELAVAIGVSRATLYRYCRTREQLVERLIAHALDQIGQAIADAELETAPPRAALRRLIANLLEYRQMSIFLIRWRPDDGVDLGCEAGWDATMDAFFLRGQQSGDFRIDIPAPALSESFIGVQLSLLEAERRGRVARGSLGALIEQIFLHGAEPKTAV